MKKIILFMLLIASTSFLPNIVEAANEFEARVNVNEKGYLEFQIRCINNAYLPTTSTPISQISFEIRWIKTSVADVEVLCSNNYFSIVDGLNAKKTKGSYYWRNFVKVNPLPIYPNHNWTLNVWETIAVFKVTGTATTTFEVAPKGWVDQELVWTQGDPAVVYQPDVNGSVSNYDSPTLVYNYVWKGGAVPPPNFKKWDVAANWTDECSGTSNSYPCGGDNENVLIPDGCSYYPEATSGGDDYAFICDNLFIDENAHIIVPDLSGQESTYKYFRVVKNATINGKLYLPAKGYVTVLGKTHLGSANAIQVRAGTTGVGSFIDNGTITYSSKGGSAKVETYLANSAGSGKFYIHLVGPTVDEENYSGTGTGAYLSAFNVSNGYTYAYYWDETVSSSSGWKNIYSLSYEVQSGKGIALSTTDATSYTMSMTGELLTGDVKTPALTYSNNHFELISNPYPSSVDFDAMASGNSSVINNKYWLWDPATGSYITRSSESGGQQYVQVGQAFFVETKSAGQVTFKNSYRAHSSDAFRKGNLYELTMNVEGGDKGFKDELIVRFVNDATYGYDEPLDALKWNSMYDDATQIRSIAEDGSELAVNFLPLEGLQTDMVSVPVQFQCGYSGDYTFNFEGVDSFETGVEIWLEDKNATEWVNINENPVYTFTANPNDLKDRFIIHFFGPTGVNEISANRDVDIYSWKHNAFVVNNTNEKIENVLIYNVAGSLIKTVDIPDGQKVTKMFVPGAIGYYIVKVITDKDVFTNKVLIEN
jgi:hypothetical protein